MKSIIIGTAGHIDHGKTALVRALTGIDTDRLEEEKRRGITIDLGFAHLELTAISGEKLRFGFIDVPGHERFVRNMLAGVGGIDLVLLVISADESIKPQTREHFEICRLLSIPRGITVITKSDLVDEDTLSVVRMEVEEFVRGSFLDTSRSPMVAVSARTAAGLEELKNEIARLAGEIPARDTEALLRLPIDRVFAMKGFGTVTTGTLIAGKVQKEDEVEVFPTRQKIRVRGVQVHGSAAEKAIAGQRTALNLAGVAVEDLARGMTLATPGALEPTQKLDVRISLLRDFSPVVTIGGAVVLDAFPMRRQKKTVVVAFLNALTGGSLPEIALARILRHGADGLSMAGAVRETGLKKGTLQPVMAALLQQKKIVQAGESMIAAAAFTKSLARIAVDLDAFHKANPLVAGIGKEELREKLGLSPEVMEALLAQLARDKKAEVMGEQVRLAGRGVALRDDEAKAKADIEHAFASAGLKVPAMYDVLGKLPIDKARAQKLVTLLLRDRVLVKLADDLVFHQTALESLRQIIAGYKAQSAKIDVAKFKDLTGVSRKYAIPLLEYLDRERVTRRVGDERVIL